MSFNLTEADMAGKSEAIGTALKQYEAELLEQAAIECGVIPQQSKPADNE